MEGRPFAHKEDPEHDDGEPPSDTDSDYRRIRVYDAAGRTDYADRMIRGLAADGASLSCAESTAHLVLQSRPHQLHQVFR